MKCYRRSTEVNMQNLQTLLFRSGQACACPLALLWNQPDRLIRVRMFRRIKDPDPPVKQTRHIPNGNTFRFYLRLVGGFFESARAGTAVPYRPDGSRGAVTIGPSYGK
jgi:hypothetical protein